MTVKVIKIERSESQNAVHITADNGVVFSGFSRFGDFAEYRGQELASEYEKCQWMFNPLDPDNIAILEVVKQEKENGKDWVVEYETGEFTA